MIEKLVLGGIWTGGFFNPDALTNLCTIKTSKEKYLQIYMNRVISPKCKLATWMFAK